MTVFIVLEDGYSTSEVTGVFSSRKKAIEHIAEGLNIAYDEVEELWDYGKIRYDGHRISVIEEEIK